MSVGSDDGDEADEEPPSINIRVKRPQREARKEAWSEATARLQDRAEIDRLVGGRLVSREEVSILTRLHLKAPTSDQELQRELAWLKAKWSKVFQVRSARGSATGREWSERLSFEPG